MDLSQGAGLVTWGVLIFGVNRGGCSYSTANCPFFQLATCFRNTRKCRPKQQFKCVMIWRKIAHQSSQVVLVEQPKKMQTMHLSQIITSVIIVWCCPFNRGQHFQNWQRLLIPQLSQHRNQLVSFKTPPSPQPPANDDPASENRS